MVFQAGCKVIEREEEEREVEECEVKRRRRRSRSRRALQTQQVSVGCPLHSTLEQSCSSGAGCLNLENQPNKS